MRWKDNHFLKSLQRTNICDVKIFMVVDQNEMVQFLSESSLVCLTIFLANVRVAHERWFNLTFFLCRAYDWDPFDNGCHFCVQTWMFRHLWISTWSSRLWQSILQTYRTQRGSTHLIKLVNQSFFFQKKKTFFDTKFTYQIQFFEKNMHLEWDCDS